MPYSYVQHLLDLSKTQLNPIRLAVLQSTTEQTSKAQEKTSGKVENLNEKTYQIPFTTNFFHFKIFCFVLFCFSKMSELPFSEYMTETDIVNEKEVEKDFILSFNYNKRVIREYKYFMKEMGKDDAITGVRITQPGADTLYWDVEIDGPVGSPYEGGVFELSCMFPFNYPNEPPRINFKTQIYHPNVSSNGSICFNPLKTEIWQSNNFTTAVVLVGIRLLLADPTAEDPLNYEAGQLFLKDRNAFNQKAKEVTAQFAMNKHSITISD